MEIERPDGPPSADHEGAGGRIRLVVLFGGQSAEHEVSRVSARHLLAAVDPQRYDIEPIGITKDGRWVRADEAARALQQGPDALPDALPVALIKPLSGGGARGMMVETMKTFGADSFPGRLACVIQGSTETTFYVLAVYFGSVGV